MWLGGTMQVLADLLEQAVEINMNDITSVRIEKNVLAMPIPESRARRSQVLRIFS